MDHVLQAKYAALAPDESGNFTSNSVGKAAGGKNVCVFILGFRVNHPLSVAAPGAFKIMQHFVSMRDDLEKNASANGFLGNEVLLNSGHRTSKSEIKTIWYFSSMNDVMAFAQSPVHRNGWDYYNKVIKQYTYLGIMHEMYETAAGHWENVYVNHQPVGLAATSFPKADKDGISWFDPIADARKGQLASTMGRLGRDRSKVQVREYRD